LSSDFGRCQIALALLIWLVPETREALEAALDQIAERDRLDPAIQWIAAASHLVDHARIR